MQHNKTGIVLLNMGGPATLADVRPFLYNLFCDREIIRLGPAFLQKPLAWIIARKRAPKSMANYAKIGGGSPLQTITCQQAAALEHALENDGDFKVTVAMRYWSPFADEAITTLLQHGIKHILLLSLYPHFSKATTGSSVSHFRKCLRLLAPEIPLQVISSWATQPFYIKALAESICEGLQAFGSQEVTVVYSAHSLPVSFINEGDPYVDHIHQCIQAVETITGVAGKLCYQSRSGPVEWLSPSTPDMLHELADTGCKHILMVPISFVSDHIETLYEIKILYKELAATLGMNLQPCASLNTNATFIEALRQLVLAKTSAPFPDADMS